MKHSPMKIIGIVFAIFFIIFMCIVPIVQLYFSHDGFYSPFYNAAFCKTEWACKHEIGHYVDDYHNGASDEFVIDAFTYYLYAHRYGINDDVSRAIINSILHDRHEMYANIYASSSYDDLPGILQQHYPNNDRYDKLYNCLMKDDFQICGRFIHVEKR